MKCPHANPSPHEGSKVTWGKLRNLKICRTNYPGGHNSPSHWLLFINLSSLSERKKLGYSSTFQVSFHAKKTGVFIFMMLCYSRTIFFEFFDCHYLWNLVVLIIPAPPSAALNHELLVILVHREWCGLFADQMLGARMGGSIDSDCQIDILLTSGALGILIYCNFFGWFLYLYIYIYTYTHEYCLYVLHVRMVEYYTYNHHYIYIYTCLLVQPFHCFRFLSRYSDPTRHASEASTVLPCAVLHAQLAGAVGSSCVGPNGGVKFHGGKSKERC